ncbi:Ribonuclease H-like domain containing protein, partial [Trema orientale]
EKIVLNTSFWKKVNFVVKSVDPILQVLQKVDSGDSLSMPSIYYEMNRAKLAIKSINGDDASKYGPFWDVVESHWNLLYYHPLYMAAHFLNPSYRYQPDFMAHTEVVRGVNECIARLEPDTAKRV